MGAQSGSSCCGARPPFYKCKRKHDHTAKGTYTNANDIAPSREGSILSTHYEVGGLLPRQQWATRPSLCLVNYCHQYPKG